MSPHPDLPNVIEPVPNRGRRRGAWLRAGAGCVLALAGAWQGAQAGVTFRLDRLQAGPGESIRIQAIFFNDGNASVAWDAPRELILQWRDGENKILRTPARLRGGTAVLDVPVGRFSSAIWEAVVPDVKGLQAIGIEGEPVLLALDTTPTETGAVVGTKAYGPIVNPENPQGAVGVVPDVAPAQAATSVAGSPNAPESKPDVGPAPADVKQVPDFSNSVLDRFRSALSPYEPVYFSFGTRPDTNARFQVSMKFRFAQPADADHPTFWDNFYFGYTQTSLWDIGATSAPFRDSSYKPAFFWLSDRVWESRDQRYSVGFDSGFEHESNGQGGVDSRSVNALYLRPTLRYRFGDGSTLSFAPKIRPAMWKDDNPDITDYRGRVDYQLRWAQDDGWMFSALARVGSKKGSLQLDSAYPLRKLGLGNINGFLHLQYFTGYGETLLDYNMRAHSQLRVGIMVVR